MKFGFWFDYDHTYTLVKVFNAIKRRLPNAQASGFVISDRYLGHARDNLPPGTSLISFYDLLARARQHRPTEAELAEFPIFDERHRLSRIAYSDRHLSMWRYDELAPHYIYMMKAFRKYIETERPDVFIFDAMSAQHAHLFCCVLRDMGVKFLIPLQFGIDDLNYFCENPYWQCPDVWGLFEDMQAGRDAPSADERAWAQAYIERVRSGAPAYFNQAVALEARKFSLPKFNRLFNYLRNYFLYDHKDPHQINPLRRIAKIVRLRINRALSGRYLTDAAKVEDGFILFPLHFEPEFATLVLSQYDQLSVIDIIIRQLPLGARLVAKEHPAMAGQRSWRFYRDALRRYPNLVFVPGGVSFNALVRRARAMVTFNGTAILESLILQRPTIFTSRARYGGFGLGVFTENLIQFQAALAASATKIADDETLIRMLSAVRRKSYGFEIMEPLGAPKTLTDDNIEKIAGAVLHKLALA